MSILKTSLLFCSLFIITACNNKEDKNTVILKNTTPETTKIIALSKAEKILKKTINAHGGALFNTANYSFIFRENTYKFKNEASGFEYTKTVEKKDSTIVDILKNGKFSRKINGQPTPLTNKQITSGTGAINSVIYFATLPYKLNDDAVKANYVESTTIKNNEYDVLEITFNEKGGGEDHDDEFYYWINKDTNKIDYLAYSYNVNNGGVRFRSAYNTRVVDGITFQDYINYKAEVGTALKDLPQLFEAGKLKELSKIKTENVINLNKN